MRGHSAAPGLGEAQVSIHIEDLSHEKTEYVDNFGQLQLLSQVRLSAGHGRRLQNIYSQPRGYRDKL